MSNHGHTPTQLRLDPGLSTPRVALIDPHMLQPWKLPLAPLEHPGDSSPVLDRRAVHLVAPLAADAQRSGELPRIGYLGHNLGPFADAFRQGLHDVGYLESQNLVIEYRWAEGKGERLPTLAAEMVRLSVDVLIAAGSQAGRAAQHATSTIPIVFAHVGDPVGYGLVASLVRPGGNITGVSVMGVVVGGKQLEVLKEAVPGGPRVAVLRNPANPGAAQGLRALDIRLHPIDVRAADEFERAFATITPGHPDALLMQQDPLFFSH